MITIKVLDNIEQKLPPPTFFQSQKWLELWSKHFSKNKLILEVNESNNTVGLAAFEINKDNKIIEFLGVSAILGNELVTDYGDIIYLQGKQNLVWENVLKHFHSFYPSYILNLNFVREDSPSLDHYKNSGATINRVDTSPYLILPDSWEKYLESLDRKNRHELRRKIRRLEKYGVIFESGAIDNNSIDELIRLMKFSEDKNKFLSANMQIFFKDIVKTFNNNEISIDFLKFENKNIAATLSFKYKKILYLYNSGFDPNYSSLSPGLLSKAFLIKKAIEQGYSEFDFLRGNERYKYDLGGRDRRLYNITLMV